MKKKVRCGTPAPPRTSARMMVHVTSGRPQKTVCPCLGSVGSLRLCLLLLAETDLSQPSPVGSSSWSLSLRPLQRSEGVHTLVPTGTKYNTRHTLSRCSLLPSTSPVCHRTQGDGHAAASSWTPQKRFSIAPSNFPSMQPSRSYCPRRLQEYK